MTQLSPSSLAELLAPCNRTELYQICRRNGLYVLPGSPREDMIEYILGLRSPPVSGHPIDAWRHAIMDVIIEHADVVQATLNCPAKTLDPRACFQCPDTRVMACLIQNPNDEPLIATRRLVRPSHRENKDSDMSNANANAHLTIANAPRDLEQLKLRSIFRLSTLGNELASKVNPQTGQPLFPTKNDQSEAGKAVWSAFTTGQPAVFAPIVYNALLQHDQIYGAPAGQAPPQHPVMPQAAAQAMQPQQTAPQMVQPQMAQPGMMPQQFAQPQMAMPQQFTQPGMMPPRQAMGVPGGQLSIPTGPGQMAMPQQFAQPGMMPQQFAQPGMMPQQFAQPQPAQQAAAPAAEATQARPARTPKTSAAAADNSEVVAQLKGITAALENNTAAINALAQATTKLVARAETDGARIENIEAMVRGLTKGNLYGLAMMLQIGEQILQLPSNELAEAASRMEPVIANLFEPNKGKG